MSSPSATQNTYPYQNELKSLFVFDAGIWDTFVPKSNH